MKATKKNVDVIAFTSSGGGVDSRKMITNFYHIHNISHPRYYTLKYTLKYVFLNWIHVIVTISL